MRARSYREPVHTAEGRDREAFEDDPPAEELEAPATILDRGFEPPLRAVVDRPLPHSSFSRRYLLNTYTCRFSAIACVPA
jgi:hypothetical protein